MNEQNGRTNSATGVGSRVKVTVPGPDSGGVAYTGVVIEDYASMVIDSESVGRDWAPPVHRWAIALDDGRLVFADDEDLAAAD